MGNNMNNAQGVDEAGAEKFLPKHNISLLTAVPGESRDHITRISQIALWLLKGFKELRLWEPTV